MQRVHIQTVHILMTQQIPYRYIPTTDVSLRLKRMFRRHVLHVASKTSQQIQIQRLLMQ